MKILFSPIFFALENDHLNSCCSTHPDLQLLLILLSTWVLAPHQPSPYLPCLLGEGVLIFVLSQVSGLRIELPLNSHGISQVWAHISETVRQASRTALVWDSVCTPCGLHGLLHGCWCCVFLLASLMRDRGLFLAWCEEGACSQAQTSGPGTQPHRLFGNSCVPWQLAPPGTSSSP